MITDESRLAAPEFPRIADRYVLRRLLASGVSTEVYLADDTEQMVEVALKVLRPSANSMLTERFRRAATIGSSLTHPNIATVFDRGTDDGHEYIVMEYVAGGSLSSLISRTWAASHLDLDEVARIGSEIAWALDYMHGRGYIHQRLNPANILLDSSARPKLIDFIEAGTAQGDYPVDLARVPLSNASYLASEQALGQRASALSDQYSLGAILYEMATGRPPFVGESPALVAHKHVHEAAIPPRWMNGAIPAALEGVILRALAKDPARRYPSAGELATDLDRVRSELAGASGGPAPATSVVAGAATGLLGDEQGAPQPAPVAAPATRLLVAPNVAGSPEWAPTSSSASSASGSLNPPRQRRRPRAALTIGLALLTGCVGVYEGRSLGAASASRHATVPVVTGLSAAEATGQLRLVGLKVATRSRPAASNEIGEVLAQVPAGKDGVARGTTVTITVGIAQMIAVPDVEKLPIATARRELATRGLQVAVKNVAAASPRQPNGLVLSQTPSSKLPARAGSEVTLSVVLVKKVAVPNTAGMNLSEAAVLLQQSGLKVAPKFANLNSATVPAGSVVRSAPASGSQVAKGSAVQLVVSEGSGATTAPTPTTPPVVVPSVVGEKVQRAASEMKSAGLNYRVIQESTGDAARNGIVAKTSPRSGRSTASDGVVTMWVWVFAPVPAVTAPSAQNPPLGNS